MSAHYKNLKKKIPDLDERRILDVGCGEGHFLVRAGGVGIETSQEKLDICKEKGVDAKFGDALDMHFANDSFDFINVGEVIEHVTDPSLLLKELHRVGSERVIVYISVPNRYSIHDPHYHMWFVNWLPRAYSDRAVDFFGKTKRTSETHNFQRLENMHYFTPKQFERFTETHGFKVRDSRAQTIVEKFGSLALLPYYLFRPWYFHTNHYFLTK